MKKFVILAFLLFGGCFHVDVVPDDMKVAEYICRNNGGVDIVWFESASATKIFTVYCKDKLKRKMYQEDVEEVLNKIRTE